MNLILYRYNQGHKFYGMRNYPEPFPEDFEGCGGSPYESHEEAIIMSENSALEIVNPELLDRILLDTKGRHYMNAADNDRIIKDGDTFPLPSNLRFEEVEQQRTIFSHHTSEWVDKGRKYDFLKGNDFRKVLRLVSVESEESQEDLLLEIMNAIAHNDDPLKHFTIQRKKI